MRTRTLFASCTLLAIAVASPARAATTIGDNAFTPDAAASGPMVIVQESDPPGTAYGVPAGGGVVTSVSTRMEAAGSVLLVRPAAGDSYTVVGRQEVPAPAAPDAVVTVPTRIPVAAGDRLAAYVPADGGLLGAADSAGAIRGFPSPTPPVIGQTLSGGMSGGSTTVRFALGATIEPDADHDGYGDETQDTCPAVSDLHDGACATDLAVTAGASPATITQGDVTTIVAPITASGQTAPGASATLGVPAGLSIVAASTTAGDCAGTVCPLGTLAIGETRKAYIVVRGTAVGVHTLTVRATSDRADGNPSNNVAAVTVKVDAPPATGTPAPPVLPPTVKLCRVPSLKGKTAAAAKTALKKAGCAAGKATGSKAKKAKVKSQTIPAGVRVVAGTKVGYALKAPAKAKAKKQH